MQMLQLQRKTASGAKAVSILGKDCFKAIQAPDIRVSIVVECFLGGRRARKYLGAPLLRTRILGHDG